MSDCIFCKIIAGEIPSAVIFEDDEFKVIIDAFPAAKGHVLILPKKHSADIYEIDEEQAGRLFKLATRVAKAIEKSGIAEGLNVLQNNGEVAGQTVHHFHMHLIPRKKDDNIKVGWKTGSYNEAEQEEYKNKIAGNL